MFHRSDVCRAFIIIRTPTRRHPPRCRFRFQFVPFCLRGGLKKNLFSRLRVAFPGDILFCRSKVVINFAFLPKNISSFPIKSRTITPAVDIHSRTKSFAPWDYSLFRKGLRGWRISNSITVRRRELYRVCNSIPLRPSNVFDNLYVHLHAF